MSQSKGWGSYVKETEEKKRREPKLKDVLDKAWQIESLYVKRMPLATGNISLI